jgi:hypothetical protein
LCSGLFVIVNGGGIVSKLTTLRFYEAIHTIILENEIEHEEPMLVNLLRLQLGIEAMLVPQL